MERQELIEKINATLAQNFELGVDLLRPDAHIFNDLKLDSLDAVDMLVHLEDQMGVKIDIEKLRDAQTLKDIYSLIEETVTPN